MSEVEAKKKDVESAPRPVKVTLPKLGSMNLHSKLTLRIGLAAFFIWLAQWLVFSMRPIAAVFNVLLGDQLAEVVDEIPVGIKVIGQLGFTSGIVYIALGLLSLVIGLWLLRRSFVKLDLLGLKLSELRLVSVVYGVVFFYLLVQVFSFLMVALQVDPEGLSQVISSLYGLLGGY